MSPDTPLLAVPRTHIRAMIHQPECRYAKKAAIQGHAMRRTAAEADGVLIACSVCLPDNGGLSGLRTFRMKERT